MAMGFEIEFNSDRGIGTIARALNVHTGKRSISRFNKNNLFAYVYDDGSVNTEIVTRPIKPEELKTFYKQMLPIWKNYVNNYCNAGGHVTFGVPKNFDGSKYAKTWVKVVREFYSLLFYLTHYKGANRKVHFCSLMQKPNNYQITTVSKNEGRDVLEGTDGYPAVLPRQKNGEIFAVEVRLFGAHRLQLAQERFELYAKLDELVQKIAAKNIPDSRNICTHMRLNGTVFPVGVKEREDKEIEMFNAMNRMSSQLMTYVYKQKTTAGYNKIECDCKILCKIFDKYGVDKTPLVKLFKKIHKKIAVGTISDRTAINMDMFC